MSAFTEVLTLAFVTQLAALPGEKVQFIIASLSTEYDPRIVVAAAGSAFGIWTVIEILVGEGLQRLIPGVVLDVTTAALFAVFGILLLRSMPARTGSDEPMSSDGGGVAASIDDVTLFGYRLTTALGGFIPIFSMMFAGEFGDKTQLVTIGLASDYGATPAIWLGEMLAIIPVSMVNAYFFDRFSGKFDARKAHLVSAVLFFFFAGDTLLDVGVGVSVWEELVALASQLL
ncbi:MULTISPECIES: TMEM165/GDT1 family protein [Halobacterium]|uniref:TMEM165/GDT1 family protein n=1 Tax=Halobacterium TaxID=2239 RepID=UPI00196462F6|nr:MULTISPECIES: TMEM165/GDT1 family protein [Halobacterium]MDL0122589.1 TMEM165/GDT1 family protein [Halobacterium salinarum]MDL0132796.1 TMEM165/GDT1 family protein [Halobacterium salinarum]QRY25201.1 TMEM165/GDT1 family protein [Halobacterium sp. BOL4-2]